MWSVGTTSTPENAAPEGPFLLRAFLRTTSYSRNVRKLVAAARHLGFGAHHFDTGQQAELDFAFVVAEELLREFEVKAASLDLGRESDQVPVETDHAVDRGHDLLLERKVGNFAIILGDADVDRIQAAPEALGKALRDRQAEIRIERRIEVVAVDVVLRPRIREVELKACSGEEPLRVAHLLTARIHHDRARASNEITRLGISEVVPADA